MVTYTIEQIDWDKIKLFWEKWKIYDMTIPTKKIFIKNVFIDLDIFQYDKIKTLGFFKDGELLGCGQVMDLKIKGVCGIANMAVNQVYRSNSIGKAILTTMIYYTKQYFDTILLFSSLYATQINFYEKVGFKKIKDNLMILGKEQSLNIINKIKKF